MKAYRAVAAEARAEVRDQGSVFLAVLRPAASVEEARRALAAIEGEHADATHCCFAWRLGPEPASERSSDAGEPRGTAGPPILRALRAAGVSDALCVVVRWFGGTKLGKGGLARAYAAAADAALAQARIVERRPRVHLDVVLPYGRLGALKRLLRPGRVELIAEEYDGSRAHLRLRVDAAESEALRAALAALGISAAEAPGRG